MASLYEAFRGYGGLWITILLAVIWIAFAQLPDIKDPAQRLLSALSQPGVMKTAVGIALVSWVWNFGRLFSGDAYLRVSGELEEFSTILLVLILVLATVAWRGISWPRLGHLRPWLTHGLVLALIVCSGPLLLKAPKVDLSQGKDNDSQPVAFVQGRLKQLNCYKAVNVPEPTEVSFNALTARAVIAFQSANDLLKDPQTDSGIGAVRHNREFPLLARPFPFMFWGPKRCKL